MFPHHRLSVLIKLIVLGVRLTRHVIPAARLETENSTPPRLEMKMLTTHEQDT